MHKAQWRVSVSGVASVVSVSGTQSSELVSVLGSIYTVFELSFRPPLMLVPSFLSACVRVFIPLAAQVSEKGNRNASRWEGAPRRALAGAAPSRGAAPRGAALCAGAAAHRLPSRASGARSAPAGPVQRRLLRHALEAHLHARHLPRVLPMHGPEQSHAAGQAEQSPLPAQPLVDHGRRPRLRRGRHGVPIRGAARAAAHAHASLVRAAKLLHACGDSGEGRELETLAALVEP